MSRERCLIRPILAGADETADHAVEIPHRQDRKKDEPEPEKWLLEVPHLNAHESGSPGLFALAPQMRVYIDNVTVTPNQ